MLTISEVTMINYVIGISIAALVVWIIIKKIIRLKKGQTGGCGCGCRDCTAGCHLHQNNKSGT